MAIHIQPAVYINGINRTSHTVMPIKWGNFLDERLDECRLSLRSVQQENFPPLTPVEIVFTITEYFGIWKKNPTIIKTKTETKRFIVANDSATEFRPKSGLYNHDLYLIEPTKVAECFVVDTITFTNDLGRNYTENPAPMMETIGTGSRPGAYKGMPKSYISPILARRNFNVVAFADIWKLGTQIGSEYTDVRIIVYCDGKTIYDTDDYTYNYPELMPYSDFTLYDLSLGFYQIVYNGKYQYDGTFDKIKATYPTVTYSFYVVENKNPLKKWSITDVINRTLDIAEPLRRGEKSRFRLNAEQAERFDKILAPQFSFTKQTLRECLQEIGKVIHGEPRLSIQKDEDGYFYEVSYDMYAGQEESNLNFMPYTSKSSQHVIENYTAWLDSNAENLVNQLDKYSGVIVEPYDGGAKSVRTENMYVRIEESNMLIPTQYPIYSVEKLEYVYVDGSTVKSVDITSWLFEKSVYDTQLQSYTEQYPYSKAYGLYYQQGAKNIGGLNFKVDKAAFAAFTNYAIINILRQALNNTKYSVSEYPTMSFRVTYTPFYNARVAQTKSYFKDFMRPAALIYNQSANVIESRYFGENLKGAVARLGNVDLSLTYVMKWLDQIPKAGQMFNRDYYISTVAVEMLPTYIRCTVGLSKDFNRISEYIGINSERRYSEISQTQAVERNTLYREYIVVGKQEQSDSDCLIGDKMLKSISGVFGANYMGEGTFNYGEYEIGYLDGEHEDIKFFNGYDLDAQYAVDVDGKLYAARARAELNDDGDGGSILTHFYIRISNLSPSVAPSGTGKIYQNYYLPLTNVCAWGTSYQGNNAGGAVNLPVISSAFGNSISFAWQYADNYSAGAVSLKQDNAIESGSNKITGYFQGDQPYTDYYGRIFYYDFDLQEKGRTLYNTNFEDIAQSLPQGTKPTESSGYVSTVGKTPYILRKDNREALQVNFQIDFVTNLDNLIIGSALASYCPAVRGSDIKLVAKLYVFETELNKFTDHIEAYEDEKLKDIPSVPITVNFGNGYFTVEAEAFPKSGKSWAIVTNQYEGPTKEVEDEFGKVTQQKEVMGGDLLIGQNIEVTAGQAFTPIYFTKKREIFDKSVWTDKR